MAQFIKTLPGVWGWVLGDAPGMRDVLANVPWKSPLVVFKVMDSVLRGIAQVAFGNNPLSGLLILIGLFVGNVMAGLGAVVCSLTAVLTAKVLNWRDEGVAAGHSNFNAVLIGVATTSLYPPVFHQAMPLSVWAYMVVAAVFTVCVMAGLGRIMQAHNIAALTLPFNIVVCSTFVCLKMAGYGTASTPSGPSTAAAASSNSSSTHESIEWDGVFLGTVLSAGHVWAVQDVACSCLVLLALFIFSPILTLASYVGATLGTLTGLVVSSAPYTSVYNGVWGYNGFLSAGCISFFVVSRPRVLLVSALNAVLATLIQSALVPVFGANGLPVFTFPFCLASVLMLATAVTTAPDPDSIRVDNPAFPELHLILHDIKRSSVDPEAVKDNIEVTPRHTQ